MRLCLLLPLLLLAPLLYAHEAHREGRGDMQERGEQERVHKINTEYLRTIKPIFRAKCFDCHSAQTKYPWYYPLPIAKQIIDRDIREGRKHIDMTSDFPFSGHHPPMEQLEVIKKVVQNNSMPLMRYRLLNWGSGLTLSEKGRILQWINAAQAIDAAPE
ncbi:MAG: heme-binding domain-containing protein [Deltaproteobacteria bacterium]|nr:heme-binding domain-containing protein [Deltaproteobacteria bacterium]